MNAQDTRRVTVALAVLLASPGYVFCGLRHICMAGHMQHHPYPIWHYVLDSIWVACFVTSAVLLWKSNLQLRKTVFAIIGFLFLSRLVLGSGGGALFLIEVPLLIFLITLAARSLLRSAPDLTQVSNVERVSHRKSIRRRWGIALLSIGTTAFLIWGIPRCYWFFRGMLAPTIEVASVPFSKDISLSPGAARVIKLPNHKTVAVWCQRTSGMMGVLENSDLALEYGAAPFKTLEREEIALPDGATTGGEYLSYIRQGAVISSSDSTEYILYVDEYCLSLAKKPDVGQNLPLKISVRLSSDKERIPKKQEREYYLSAISSDEPKKRLEAVHELGETVSLGSIYAGNRAEIANAIRPLLRDSDAGVRKEALTQLRVMGDDDALLELLTPRPVAEFSEPNGAWTIAGWCRQESDRVPKQVMRFLDSEDPKLQEFALAFFSCFKKNAPEAQPYVEKYLKSSSPQVRTAAASAIRNTCEHKTAARLLYEALEDKSDTVLLEALREIGQFNGEIPVHRITGLLGHENAEVRERAAAALESYREPIATEALLKATHDNQSRVRAQAAVSLGRNGCSGAYQRLVDMLNDSSADVRESAVNGLRWLGRPEAVQFIAKMQEADPNKEVREMAKRTVRELGGK